MGIESQEGSASGKERDGLVWGGGYERLDAICGDYRDCSQRRTRTRAKGQFQASGNSPSVIFQGGACP